VDWEIVNTTARRFINSPWVSKRQQKKKYDGQAKRMGVRCDALCVFRCCIVARRSDVFEV